MSTDPLPGTIGCFIPDAALSQNMPKPRRFTSELSNVKIKVFAFNDHPSPSLDDRGWVSKVSLKPFAFDVVLDKGELNPSPGRMCHGNEPQGCQNLVVLDEPFTIMVINMNGRVDIFPRHGTVGQCLCKLLDASPIPEEL